MCIIVVQKGDEKQDYPNWCGEKGERGRKMKIRSISCKGTRSHWLVNWIRMNSVPNEYGVIPGSRTPAECSAMMRDFNPRERVSWRDPRLRRDLQSEVAMRRAGIFQGLKEWSGVSFQWVSRDTSSVRKIVVRWALLDNTTTDSWYQQETSWSWAARRKVRKQKWNPSLWNR